MRDNMIKSLSVKFRLFGFILLLLVIFLVTGLFGLNGMKTTNKSLSSVYKHQVLPLNELRTLENLINIEIVKPVDKLLFEQMTWEECLVHIEKAQKNINSSWQYLQTVQQNNTDRDSDWLLGAEPLINESDNILNSLIILLKSKNADNLDVFTDNKLYPLAHRYSEGIDTLIHHGLDAVEAEYKESQHRYSTAKTAFLLSLAGGVAISCLLSFLLVQSIDQPLGKITRAMKRLMNGDLSKKMEYDSGDEFGYLIRGFNQMSST